MLSHAILLAFCFVEDAIQHSSKHHFFQGPDPPRAVTTSRDPKRSAPHFVITIEDEIQRGKSYQILLKPFNEPDAPPKSIPTSKLETVVDDLRPGTPYIVHVKSIFHDKESNEVEAVVPAV